MNRCCFGGCVATENLRRFQVVIGGEEPLWLQPEFCEPHMDQILIRVGVLIGEMLLGKVAPL